MKQYVLYTVIFLSLFCQTIAQKNIVFIGDSITDGKWGQECDGTRNTDDMNHIFGHGYMFLCASEYMAIYPDMDLSFYNRGISGNTINDLEARWKTDVLDLNPDVLSVLIGINDILNAQGLVDTIAFEKTYRSLLERSRKQNPNLTILLGEPFCEQGFRIDSEGKSRKMCEALSRCVQRIATDYNAVFIPYQNMFDVLCAQPQGTNYWIWDGVHPTPAGHFKMAELWKKAFEKQKY